jgi:hypothetical protein
MGERGNACRIFVGKGEGKRSLGRPKCRWKYIITMQLREIKLNVRDWVDLAPDTDQRKIL